jgi:hypothetical protein
MYNTKIYKYDLDGNFVKEYESILDAVFQNNISYHSVLIKAINRKTNYCKGFLWSTSYKIKVQPYKPKKVDYDLKNKSVHKYDLMGNYICSYSNYTFAAKELGCKPSIIHKALNIESRQTKGFLWSLEKTDKINPYTTPKSRPIGLYDLNGNLIERFLNIKDASKKLNMTDTIISKKLDITKKSSRRSKYRKLIFKTIIDKEVISSDELTQTV